MKRCKAEIIANPTVFKSETNSALFSTTSSNFQLCVNFQKIRCCNTNSGPSDATTDTNGIGKADSDRMYFTARYREAKKAAMMAF